MSKTVKKVAGFAAPIVGNIIAPGIGGVIGGAVGGAVSGGGLKGALTGAAIGGIAGGALGTAAGTPLAGGAQGATQGTGILGNLTRGTGVLSKAVGGLAGATGIGGGSVLPTSFGGLVESATSPTSLLGGSGNRLLQLGSLASGISEKNQAEKAIGTASRQSTRALEQARARLEPFEQAGAKALPQLQRLVNDPNAQSQFINANPFFQQLADEAERRLLDRQAARGRLGTGETAKELQNQLVLLGEGLLDRQVGRSSNLVNIGQRAAGDNAAITADIGDTLANATIARQQAGASGTQNILNTLAQLQRQNLIKQSF